MAVTVTLDDLARAVRKLREHPPDTAAWLEVAALLHALGATDDAELAFAAIGEGARVGGQVALAVACARHLAELGSVRGPELVDAIIETYATGGPHFAFSPPRARSATEPPALVEQLADPIAEARAVLDQLAGWLTSRPPGQVPPAPLLSALPAAGARALIGVMTARAFPAGARIIEVGEPAAALYWIAHGTVAITREAGPGDAATSVLGELHSGAFFGEIALVGGTRRTARVTASDDVWLLEIPARAIATAAERHPQLAEVLAFHARARLLANLTRTSELFRALGDADREALLARLSTELVPAGTRFITEGAPNQHLWVVVAGRCEVRSTGGAIAELGPGAAVGEISLVSGQPAVADV
ncbi:MAG TPA: cyclic nucleotide-binding domain-containing protein, partial [Kofleriaceae bacterium]|nr:cyclic nucleotide-binding domain-containing protein [Kofleriaceae bacterium]